MDSGSGGSLQSSTDGDDQEYDSKSEFVSGLFASISNPNPIPIHPPPRQPPASSFFDPSSHHHHTQDSSPFSAPNPLLFNMNPVWSTRSDPNFDPNQSLLGTAAARVVQPQQPDQHQQQRPGAVAKNPKKRTRASRRAPTTVLTTDTSNFRQMVQEFTGIPVAPFSASASPFTRRLDLFAGGGTTLPLRSSAQRLQFFNSDSPTTPSNSDHVFAKQPQNLLNLQNPLSTLQSLLQQQQQTLPNSLTNNSLDDGQQVNPSLGGFPSSSSSTRWRDLPGGEDENLGNFEGNNDNSQSGTDQGKGKYKVTKKVTKLGSQNEVS